MSVPALQVYPGTYRDSLLLMSATRAMADGPGVSWAGAVMATPAAIEDLSARPPAPQMSCPTRKISRPRSSPRSGSPPWARSRPRPGTTSATRT